MQLVFGTQQPVPGRPVVAEELLGTALVVLFADGADLARVRDDGGGPLRLSPPFHLGEDDAYLVLPDDIGEEIVDIFRDGDADLLSEALRDGLAVIGEVTRGADGRGMVLYASVVQTPALLLQGSLGYAAAVPLRGAADAVHALNTLPHAQCTTLSALVDDDGLERILREHTFIGASWQAPVTAKALSTLEPTYVFSRRLADGRVGIELALFQEDEELVAVLRPAVLLP